MKLEYDATDIPKTVPVGDFVRDRLAEVMTDLSTHLAVVPTPAQLIDLAVKEFCRLDDDRRIELVNDARRCQNLWPEIEAAERMNWQTVKDQLAAAKSGACKLDAAAGPGAHEEAVAETLLNVVKCLEAVVQTLEARG